MARLCLPSSHSTGCLLYSQWFPTVLSVLFILNLNKRNQTITAMRTLTLVIIVCGFMGSFASAASGVRIHRLSDPPLPPRSVEEMQRPSRSFSFFRRGARTRTVTSPVRRRGVPLAADRASEAPRPIPVAPKQQPIVSRTVVPAVETRPAELPVATKPVAKVPVVTTTTPVTPAPKHNVTPAPAPIARPASEQPAEMRSSRPRRRLPIAPI